MRHPDHKKVTIQPNRKSYLIGWYKAQSISHVEASQLADKWLNKLLKSDQIISRSQ